MALALEAGRFSQAYELSADSAGALEPLDAVEDRMFLSEAFRGLEESERRILYMRFVRDLKAADVVRELGLSARQLTRRTEAALGKLRHELERSSSPEEQPAAVRRQSPARQQPARRTMATPDSLDERYLAQPYPWPSCGKPDRRTVGSPAWRSFPAALSAARRMWTPWLAWTRRCASGSRTRSRTAARCLHRTRPARTAGACWCGCRAPSTPTFRAPPSARR